MKENLIATCFALRPESPVEREALRQEVEKINRVFRTQLRVWTEIVLCEVGAVLRTTLHFQHCKEFLTGIMKGFGFRVVEYTSPEAAWVFTN